MLKKINRISKTRDLQKVYRFGKTVHTSTLVIKFSANPRLKTNTLRAAFVVSKKVSKKAVERNRIKRALRETMRINLAMCAVGEYMIVTKPIAHTFSNVELRNDFLKGLEKIKKLSQF